MRLRSIVRWVCAKWTLPYTWKQFERTTIQVLWGTYSSSICFVCVRMCEWYLSDCMVRHSVALDDESATASWNICWSTRWKCLCHMNCNGSTVAVVYTASTVLLCYFFFLLLLWIQCGRTLFRISAISCGYPKYALIHIKFIHFTDHEHYSENVWANTTYLCTPKPCLNLYFEATQISHWLNPKLMTFASAFPVELNF